MKFQISLALLIVTGVASALTAQPGEARERIEAQRIAFITNELSLTPDEATRFWPIYNEYKDALREMRDDFERPDLNNLTDQEANALIDKHLVQEQKRLELKRNLLTKLRAVISPRKVILLQRAEVEFNRELLRKAQEFRKQ